VARVLVVNAGSSSLKLSLLGGDSDRPLAELELSSGAADIDRGRLRKAVVGGLEAADIVAHRIVHGGARFREAVLVDARVRTALGELSSLAPLHQPGSLAALDEVTRALPRLPAVACFDTAFHATLPDAAATFALPAQWRERWQLRRYGFHGLSHADVAGYVAATVGVGLRIVSCHLGAGASLCAIADGRSVDTTMGFTPLDGLMMATRSGSVDPGLLLWLLERTGLTERELAAALEHESGLLGLAGSADMREVLGWRAQGDERATLAIAVYLHRLRAGIASMAAALGGVDVIAFTGGVGEHADELREEAAAGLGFLAGRPRILTVHAREDLEIARQARQLLATA
jgi:acetate kinase